ncbi:hypothetical protein AOLI_G00313970 [Acnodon oligacanthus]
MLALTSHPFPAFAQQAQGCTLSLDKRNGGTFPPTDVDCRGSAGCLKRGNTRHMAHSHLWRHLTILPLTLLQDEPLAPFHTDPPFYSTWIGIRLALIQSKCSVSLMVFGVFSSWRTKDLLPQADGERRHSVQGGLQIRIKIKKNFVCRSLREAATVCLAQGHNVNAQTTERPCDVRRPTAGLQEMARSNYESMARHQLPAIRSAPKSGGRAFKVSEALKRNLQEDDEMINGE